MTPNPLNAAAPRAYSYLRFSTPEQIKGDSLRRQTALADEYAKRNGLTLDTELNLRDLGVSAYRGDNAAVGALGAFLQAIRDRLVPRGSELLVEALDRISRAQARKAVRVLEEIVEAGVALVTLNDGKRYTEQSLDGADFLLAILLFMRGNEESATKSKRLKAAWVGKRERAARGEVATGSVPAWVHVEGSATKNARNAKLSLIPERAKTVKRVFEMFLAGHGRYAITEALNSDRLPTWGGSEYWHSSYIYKILRSPTVTGRLVPYVESRDGRKRVRTPQPAIDDYYPRVIDDETFQRVQTLIESRLGTTKSATVASLVAGVAKCPLCGSTMTRVVKGAKGGVPKLVCAKAKAGAGCEYHIVKLPEVEDGLIRHAEYLADPPHVDEDVSTSIRELETELFHLGETIESLVSAIEQRPSAALSERLAAREAEREKFREELKRAKAHAADTESRVVKLRASRLAEALAKFKRDPGTVAAANAALRECVTQVVVDYPLGMLDLHWRHGGEPTRIMYAWK